MENVSGLSARLLTNSIVANTSHLALPGTIIPDLNLLVARESSRARA